MFNYSKEAQDILDKLFKSFKGHCLVNSHHELIIKHHTNLGEFFFDHEEYEEISRKEYDEMDYEKQEEYGVIDWYNKEEDNDHYFRLKDIETELEFKCKVIEWLSRPGIKGGTELSEKFYLDGVNEFLGTNFSHKEMETVYTYLGNNVNRTKCIKFIESNYDMKVLEKKDDK